MINLLTKQDLSTQLSRLVKTSICKLNITDSSRKFELDTQNKLNKVLTAIDSVAAKTPEAFRELNFPKDLETTQNIAQKLMMYYYMQSISQFELSKYHKKLLNLLTQVWIFSGQQVAVCKEPKLPFGQSHICDERILRLCIPKTVEEALNNVELHAVVMIEKLKIRLRDVATYVKAEELD